MTKIKNTNSYPYKIPVINDFIPGSDSENNGETVSFKFFDIANLINSINGNEIIIYIFLESIIGELDENGSGYFLSENNEVIPENITKLIVSKTIKTGIDLSELFQFIGDNKDGFILKLRNTSNPNNFIYFEITNVIEEEFQYTFEVSVYNLDYFNGILENDKAYAFDFNLKASNSPENYSKIVYVNSTSPTTATIFDIENPPITNNNALKNDVNNLYIGTDASTWVYITSPAGYITKTISSISSNFYLSGTLIDAGINKDSAIERSGTVGVGVATSPNHAMRKDQVEAADLSTLNAAKAYTELLTAGLLDLRGVYDASSNLFPSTGGSGTAGAILKGDFWYVSVAGILAGKSVTAGDSFFALVDSPGQTSSNWNVLETNIGYVPENLANKTDDIETNKTSSSFYASVKSVVTFILNYLFTNAPAKASALVDADLILAGDSADSFKTKTRTFAQLKSTIRTSLDTELSYACSDEMSDLVVGTLITFRMPFGMTLTTLKLSLNNAPTGSKMIVDIRKGGVSILSTLISADIGSTTSVGASVPYIISDPNLTDDSIITILTTQVGSTSAGKGLKVTFLGKRT